VFTLRMNDLTWLQFKSLIDLMFWISLLRPTTAAAHPFSVARRISLRTRSNSVWHRVPFPPSRGKLNSYPVNSLALL